MNTNINFSKESSVKRHHICPRNFTTMLQKNTILICLDNLKLVLIGKIDDLKIISDHTVRQEVLWINEKISKIFPI